MFALILLVLIAYGFYKWAILNNNYFSNRNIVHLKPSFLLGNTGRFFMKQVRINEFYQNIYNSFPKEKIFGIFDFRNPVYVIRDPELVRQITIKDFNHFEDHDDFVNEKQDDLLGNSLLLLRGAKWRDMRATLSPSFTGSKMRQMFELVGDCAFDMCEFLKKKATAGHELHYEMKDLFTKYTNDVIATSAFGISVNSFENEQNKFYVTVKKMMDLSRLAIISKMIVCNIAPWLMSALGIQLFGGADGRFLKHLVLDTIEKRHKLKIFRPDMINLMMQLKKGGAAAISEAQSTDEKETDGFATTEESTIGRAHVRRQWNDNEIVAQCFIFLFAGFDTSSTLLSFASYELALNPEIQEKLYAEICDVNEHLQGARLTYDALQKMKYMDMVVSETLRLWPPFLVIDRACVKDYTYNNDSGQSIVIEKGSAMWLPIFGFHRDAQYYPNPDQFDPERFNDEQKHTIVPGTYLPFGIGPRNCIGSRFALMEVKAVLFYLLLSFKFVPNDKTQIPMILKKIPTGPIAEKDIHLQLKLR